jgi:hypothetical protein
MAAFRALLFAVFGGFIGAAPAAPVVAGPDGACSGAQKQGQRSERPGCEVSERDSSGVAAAPPRAGAPPVACGTPPFAVARPPLVPLPPAPTGRAPAARPPLEDVRAGLTDLPPPAL